MRILIFAYWHDPRFIDRPGGLIRMYELADNLTDLGHDVTLVVPDLGFPKTQTRARVAAIPFLDLPLFRPLSFHLLSSLYLAARCLGTIDCLYVRQMNSFLLLLIGRLFRVFSYFEIPNDPYLGYSLAGPMKRLLLHFIDRRCLHWCNRIVVLSQWSRQRLHDLGGIDLKKTLVFPSGTDTKLFRPQDRTSCRRELGLSPAGGIVGFIGSFLPYQGVDTLMKAAPRILQQCPGIRFLLVGDGPMKEAWVDESRRQNLEPYFVFAGHVPYREVHRYLGAMDICIAPHQRETNQASPVKIFDYMASGRPIVASDIDVVREIIADSRCAVLIEPENEDALAKALVSLLKNPEEARARGENGRKFALAHYDRKQLTASLFSSAPPDEK